MFIKFKDTMFPLLVGSRFLAEYFRLSANIDMNPQQFAAKYPPAGAFESKKIVDNSVRISGFLCNRNTVSVGKKNIKDVDLVKGVETVYFCDNVINLYYRMIPYAFAEQLKFATPELFDNMDGFMSSNAKIGEIADVVGFYSRFVTGDKNDDWFGMWSSMALQSRVL